MMQEKRWTAIVALFFAAGCGPTAEEPDSTPWVVGDDESSGVVHTGEELEFPKLEIPAADCAVESMAGDIPKDTPATDSRVTLVERIGAEGCLTERERHAYEDGRETLYFMEYLDPDAAAYAYVEPVDYSIAYVYGGDGELLEERRAPSPDDPVKTVTEFDYDGQGRTILERRLTRNEGGIFEEIEWKAWEYGEAPPSTDFRHFFAGDLRRGHHKEFTESGELLREYTVETDGTRWLKQEWERDEVDRPLVHRVYSQDGVLQSQTTWTHRSDGTSKNRRVRHDMGWVEIRRYDAAGNQIYYSQDSDGDGQPNYVKENEYEGDQLVFERVRFAFDASGEAQSEREKRWTLDDKGRVVEMKGHKFHAPGVNIEPTRQRRTIEYLADGEKLVEHEGYHLETDELLSVTNTRFDAYGEPVWKHQFRHQQGWAPETTWMRTYDEQGRPLLIVRDSTADGTADKVIRHQYDGFGNLLEKSTDSNGDGIPDHRLIKRYGTPSL